MKQLNVAKIMEFIVANKPQELRDVLQISGVTVNGEITMQKIEHIVKMENSKGNKLVANNIAVLISKTFDLSPLLEEKGSSNFSGKRQLMIVGTNGTKKIVEY
ncbi:MAG: hypothetical protein PHT69_02010 [Bacteroidales bacterium]|nr:hypothetical protein [Bacteroidales bacterium]